MKKLIIFTLINIYFLFTSYGNDKNIIFVTSVGSSFTEARLNAYYIASINSMKVMSTQTVKQGNSWVSVAKVIYKYK